MRFAFAILVPLSLGLGFGCQQRSAEMPPPQRAAAPASEPVPLLRWHFVGTAHLAGDTNAAKLKQIAALPATQVLRAQTLQKLAEGLANLFPTSAGAETNRAALVRPLLEDVLGAETWFQLHAITNGTGTWTLAVELNDERARLWQTNLWQCLSAAEALRPFSVEKYSGFRARKFHWLRAGRWLLIAAGGDERPWLGTLQQITATGRPPALSVAWLEVEADFPRLAASLSWPGLMPWPRAQLAVSGKGEYLRSNLRLHYPQPLSLPLDPWRVPTNTIQDPLISFTALRGLAPGLKQREFITRLAVDPVPNQFFLWAQKGIPFQLFAAWPAAQASNQLTQLAPRWVAWAQTNSSRPAVGKIVQLKDPPGIAWQGLPFVVPAIHPAPEPAGDFFMAEIFPLSPGNQPLPAELLEQLTSRTNLVYYDWEITEFRLLQWRSIDQVLSMLAPDRLPQVPTPTAGPPWLLAVSPLLGNCVTEMVLTAPQELTLVRKSHLGLTGWELVTLVNWLEDPGFPTAGLPWPFASTQLKGIVPPKP